MKGELLNGNKKNGFALSLIWNMTTSQTVLQNLQQQILFEAWNVFRILPSSTVVWERKWW
jgi:hypothetical protein